MPCRPRPVAALLLLAALAPAGDGIVIDGSATVYPISLAVGEAYHGKTGTTFEINVSGTTGGMRLFSSGKLPIASASRPIRADEIDACASAGISFVEVPIALDGLTIAVGAQNTFVKDMTVAELRQLWAPGSTITSWDQVRSSWPHVPVTLCGPSQNHGSFDYFTEEVNGKARQIREGWTPAEDPNDLVQTLVANGNALAYFGFSYYQQNKAQVRAVSIDAGHGPVAPSHQSVQDGTYAPFSRPLFYYVTVAALERSEVRGYLEAVLDQPRLVEEAGYVALDETLRAAVRRRLAARTTGSVLQRAEGRVTLRDAYLGTSSPVTAAAPAATAPSAASTHGAPSAPKAAPVPVVAPAPAVVAAAAPAAAPAPTPAASRAPVAALALVPDAAPVVAAVPVTVSTAPSTAPVATAAAVSVTPAATMDLERLRAASFALARASLQRQPDVAELRRLAREVAMVTGAQP